MIMRMKFISCLILCSVLRVLCVMLGCMWVVC